MNVKRTQRKDAPVQIRWLIRRDMTDVIGIERACFKHSWSEEDFLCSLRQRNCIGMVAEQDNKIVGFMIYELHKLTLRILNFAVDPDSHRSGIGARMIGRLVDKLSQQRRREIVLEVRETNLDAQLFFHNQGFRALGVIREHYGDTAEDAYSMIFRLIIEDEVVPPFSPRNRISGLDAA